MNQNPPKKVISRSGALDLLLFNLSFIVYILQLNLKSVFIVLSCPTCLQLICKAFYFFFKNILQMSGASLFGMVKSVLSHYPKIPDSGIKIRAFALLDTFQQKVWLLREQQSLVLLVPLHCTMVQSVTKISK